MKKIVLAGNPNCGKTAVFNYLTGQYQKVSNLAGTTVEVNKGVFGDYELIDLPGTYSINPSSLDEQIAINYLITHKEELGLVVFVADKNKLYRNLLFFSQLSLLNIPLLLVCNMWDINPDFSPDLALLSDKLGVNVVSFSAKIPSQFKDLKGQILDGIKNPKYCIFYNNEKFNEIPSNLAQYENITKSIMAAHNVFLYQKNTELIGKNSINIKNQKDVNTKIDKWALHPLWGWLIMGFVLFFMFQALFYVAEFPMNGIDWFFEKSVTWLSDILPSSSWYARLILDGIIPGFAGVVIFLPQIILLFLTLGFLEDSGYMSRLSVLLDNAMSKIGLNGKSIVPLIGGFACAIPALMSARSIKNRKERLLTILITPLIACSARLPVYTVLISLLFVPNSPDALFNTRGLLFFLFYFIGLLAAILAAFVFSKILKQQIYSAESNSVSVIELPDYKWPLIPNIVFNTSNKAWQFVKSAGVIIFIISIILWFASSFGPEKKRQVIINKYKDIEMTDSLQQAQSSELLNCSYAGILGKVIEPAIKPLGYDWKIGIALISSFAAREVFVGTISTIYAIDGDNTSQVVDRLRNAKAENGSPIYTKATIVSLLLFYAFALQCMSTVAIMRRETGSWKWPIIQFLYLGVLAYCSALIAYQVLSITP